MRQYVDTLQDVQGNALVGAQVLVQNYVGGANATIYSDNAGTMPILTSTVTTGADGQFNFFCQGGYYNLVMSKNATVFKTQSPVSIFDGYPTIPPETAAGVTPTYFYFPPGDSRRYGVTGDGHTDDTAALNNLHKAVVQAELAGTYYPGTYLISSPVVISNPAGHGFSMLGPSSSSCIFAAAATFSGGTAALQYKGSATPDQFRLGGFSIQPNGAVTPGTATVGLLIGDPTTPTVGVFGYNFSTLQDIEVSNFTTLYRYTNARQVVSNNCAGWDLLGTVVTAVLIDQGSGSTPSTSSDLVFNSCQYVTTTAANNTCVAINSTVGPYNNSTGVGIVAGIKFQDCDFYAGQTVIAVTASNSSWVTDIWFTSGCQIDQQCATAMQFTSLNAGANIQNIHIIDMFINKTTTSGIAFASTGTGGALQNIWVENNWIVNAQANAISFFGPACFDLHVNNNSIVDCNSTSGRAIEFNNCTRISCSGNRAVSALLGQKPLWLIGFDAGCTDIYASGNDGVGMVLSGATIIDQSGAIANKTIVNNPGYNPIPSAAIAVTASPFTYTNNTGAPVVVYVEGGTVSNVSVGGFTTAAATNTSATVPQGASAVVIYSAAPTMGALGL
jgi:hypothetical protein